MFSITVTHGDILARPCDLLVLKHADGFYGVDARVAEIIGFTGKVPVGRTRVVPGRKTEASKIAFIGVGPLVEFGYPEIRNFGRDIVSLASKQGADVRRICMPIHGPGYGLDEAEAFSSLVAGLVDAGYDENASSQIESVEIVEINDTRARRFESILNGLLSNVRHSDPRANNRGHADLSTQNILRTFGAESEFKTRLFVAMPFKDDFNDEWEISIQEAANSLQILCERIDKSAFVGDISAEIKRRIEQYDGPHRASKWGQSQCVSGNRLCVG